MTPKPVFRAAVLAALVAVAAGCAAPTASTQPLAARAAATHPAAFLGGLERWHLTLPTSQSQQAFPADQIDQPQLATYSSEYFQLNETKTGVLMTSIMGGATTSAGTAFARTELREREASGEKSAWDCANAVRSMTLRQRILKAPTHKSEVSVGQIHDAKNDNLEVFYKGPSQGANGVSDTGVMLAKFNGMSSTKAPVLDDEYRLGDTMVVKVSTREGVMTVDYRNERSGKTSTASAPFEKIIGGCYFKAGNYPQACTKTNIYGLENPNCSKKSYTPEKFETDPLATAVLELQALSLD
nr:alginate lyase [Hydrogenophaga sp.]